MAIRKEDILEVVKEYPFKYETVDGRVVYALPVSQLPDALRTCGWRRVPRIDVSDLRKLGLEIVTARYIQGVRPKRFCDCVVLREAALQVV